MADEGKTPDDSSRICRGCKAVAPRVRTMGTLAHYGWRFRVLVQPDGTVRGEYVCPACWMAENGTSPLRNRG